MVVLRVMSLITAGDTNENDGPLPPLMEESASGAKAIAPE